MRQELTRTGVVGLELTREEVIDLKAQVEAVVRKAQCREVNSDVVDELDYISTRLADLDDSITNILEDVTNEQQ